ncbi:MAG: indolepyruvate oxidoreductase subunit beta [Elusimicrobiota bacterium]|nr:indolepyruvate oxidoreductase subunit beta [Elusimicrobiota bacterium]
MEKTKNVLIAGVGGQGVILSSDIMSQAAVNSSCDVKKSEIHGMSQRGGSVSSHIRFGEKVHSPVISSGTADIIISMEEMETLRWLDHASGETLVVVLANRILPANVKNYPGNIRELLEKKVKNLFVIEPAGLLDIVKVKKIINSAVLGAVSAFLPFGDDAWEKAFEELCPAGTADKNKAAFFQGKAVKREVQK